MKLILFNLLAISFLLSQVSCASIVCGRHESLDILSMPSGAQVRVDGRSVGDTPVATEVKRGEEHEVQVQKEGYLDDARMTRKAFNGWFVGNLLFGGLVGMIIDLADGAAFSVDPNPIQVTLIEKPVADKRSSIEVNGAEEKRFVPENSLRGND